MPVLSFHIHKKNSEEYTVSAVSDQKFLRSGAAKDCITKERIAAGDVVIVCAVCKLNGIYKKENWSGSCYFANGNSDHKPMLIQESIDRTFYEIHAE